MSKAVGYYCLLDGHLHKKYLGNGCWLCSCPNQECDVMQYAKEKRIIKMEDFVISESR